MKHQKPVIEFKGYRITNIDYRVFPSLEELEYLDLENGEMAVWVGLSEDKKEAEIKITSQVVDENHLRGITLEISGQFYVNIEENISEYLAVNGTAILYPYVRSVISILTSLDNENAIILPTLNTNNLVEG